jgi:hypothetical protein
MFNFFKNLFNKEDLTQTLDGRLHKLCKERDQGKNNYVYVLSSENLAGIRFLSRGIPSTRMTREVERQRNASGRITIWVNSENIVYDIIDVFLTLSELPKDIDKEKLRLIPLDRSNTITTYEKINWDFPKMSWKEINRNFPVELYEDILTESTKENLNHIWIIHKETLEKFHIATGFSWRWGDPLYTPTVISPECSRSVFTPISYSKETIWVNNGNTDMSEKYNYFKTEEEADKFIDFIKPIQEAHNNLMAKAFPSLD